MAGLYDNLFSSDEDTSFWDDLADLTTAQSESTYPGLFDLPDETETDVLDETEQQELESMGYGQQEDDSFDVADFLRQVGYSEEEPEDDTRQWAGVLTGKQTSATVSDQAHQAYQYLQQVHGLPAHVAAGIVGNIQQESGFNPGAVGDGGKARGLAQWHPDRWAGLQSYARNRQQNPSSFQTQLDYIIEEGRQRGDLNRLQAARTPEEAAMLWGKHYERPRVVEPSRAQYARAVYKQLGGYTQDEFREMFNPFASIPGYKRKDVYRGPFASVQNPVYTDQTIPSQQPRDTWQPIALSHQYELPAWMKVANMGMMGVTAGANLIAGIGQRQREQDWLDQTSPFVNPQVTNYGLSGINNVVYARDGYAQHGYAQQGLRRYRLDMPSDETRVVRPVNPLDIPILLPEVTVTGKRNTNPLSATGSYIGQEYRKRLESDPRYSTSPWSVGSPVDVIDPVVNFPGYVLDNITGTQQNDFLKPSSFVDVTSLAGLSAVPIKPTMLKMAQPVKKKGADVLKDAVKSKAGQQLRQWTADHLLTRTGETLPADFHPSFQYRSGSLLLNEHPLFVTGTIRNRLKGLLTESKNPDQIYHVINDSKTFRGQFNPGKKQFTRFSFYDDKKLPAGRTALEIINRTPSGFTIYPGETSADSEYLYMNALLDSKYSDLFDIRLGNFMKPELQAEPINGSGRFSQITNLLWEDKFPEAQKRLTNLQLKVAEKGGFDKDAIADIIYKAQKENPHNIYKIPFSAYKR